MIDPGNQLSVAGSLCWIFVQFFLAFWRSWNAALRATALVILMMSSLVFTSILFANLPGNAVTVYGQNQLIENPEPDFTEIIEV